MEEIRNQRGYLTHPSAANRVCNKYLLEQVKFYLLRAWQANTKILELKAFSLIKKSPEYDLAWYESQPEVPRSSRPRLDKETQEWKKRDEGRASGTFLRGFYFSTCKEEAKLWLSRLNLRGVASVDQTAISSGEKFVFPRAPFRGETSRAFPPPASPPLPSPIPASPTTPPAPPSFLIPIRGKRHATKLCQ